MTAAGAFAWPPTARPRPTAGPLASAAPIQRPTRTAPPPPGRLLAMLRAVEETWLAPTALPFDRRMEAAGWAPDPAWAYCDRCGQDVGPFESDDFGCAACRGRRLPWARLVRLGAYEGELAACIHDCKFSAWRTLGRDVGRALGRCIRAAGALDEPEAAAGVVIVPVPSSFRRRLARGIDHALWLARGVGVELGVPVQRSLSRRHRPSQRSIPASARAANVAGSFRPRPGPRPWRRPEAGGGLVVLVDDVTTTGATLRAAARALRRAGSSGGGGRPVIWAGVAAVTTEPGRRGAVTGDRRGS